ncbi:hypothetical protein [Streptomyces sp. NPDC050287]|uniref:hypothetical protein n=1 Tax=Streptomyces sp. NPDC050287 TaxID=3365608 RepID=UPI0037B43FA6
MTEVELVATALATGTAAGLTGSACGTVHDLHTELREAVRRRLGGGGAHSGRGAPSGDGGNGGVSRYGGVGGNGGVGRYGSAGGYGVRVLDAYETDPDVWRTRLLQVLTDSGVEQDEEVLAAARAVIRAERRTGHVIVGADIGGRANSRSPSDSP